jgi:hypothetical protein
MDQNRRQLLIAIGLGGIALLIRGTVLSGPVISGGVHA